MQSRLSVCRQSRTANCVVFDQCRRGGVAVFGEESVVLWLSRADKVLC